MTQTLFSGVELETFLFSLLSRVIESAYWIILELENETILLFSLLLKSHYIGQVAGVKLYIKRHFLFSLLLGVIESLRG